MFDFVITWPVWLLTTEDSVERNESGVPIGLTAHPALRAASDGDKVRLIVFTDKDLADRYLKSGDRSKWVKVSFDTPARFVEWLRAFAKKGGTSVLFDPVPVGTAYSIATIIEALERGPV